MKVAYLLPGFVRHLKNFDVIKQFIKLNSSHTIHLYTNTYNKLGSPNKEPSNKKGYIDSQTVDEKLLKEYLNFKKINIEDYDIVNNILNKFVSMNIDIIRKSKEGSNEKFSKKMKSPEDEGTIFGRLYAQWRMVYNCYNLIDEDYDLIIRGRYDLQIDNLNLNDYNIQNNTLYYKTRKAGSGIFKTTLNNSNELEIPNDTVGFGTPDTMKIYCEFGKEKNLLDTVGHKDFISDDFHNGRGKSVQLSNEACLSFWCHYLNNLNKSHILSNHLAENTLIERIKYK